MDLLILSLWWYVELAGQGFWLSLNFCGFYSGYGGSLLEHCVLVGVWIAFVVGFESFGFWFLGVDFTLGFACWDTMLGGCVIFMVFVNGLTICLWC